MGQSLSMNTEKQLTQQADIVSDQIHPMIEEWAKKWFKYIEKPDEFDQACNGEYKILSHQFALGTGKDSLYSDVVIEAHIKGRGLEDLYSQTGFICGKEIPFGRIDVSHSYNEAFKTFTYTIRCCVKKT